MGMAASQARFLGLTSRKSNVEYEGQQINQQRTALGNQTANYYNQMLGMKIPVPPAIDDYTKTLYTFSDGALKNSVTSLIARNNGLYDVSYLREWQDDFSTVAGTSHVVTRLVPSADEMAGYSAALATAQGTYNTAETAANGLQAAIDAQNVSGKLAALNSWLAQEPVAPTVPSSPRPNPFVHPNTSDPKYFYQNDTKVISSDGTLFDTWIGMTRDANHNNKDCYAAAMNTDAHCFLHVLRAILALANPGGNTVVGMQTSIPGLNLYDNTANNYDAARMILVSQELHLQENGEYVLKALPFNGEVPPQPVTVDPSKPSTYYYTHTDGNTYLAKEVLLSNYNLDGTAKSFLQKTIDLHYATAVCRLGTTEPTIRQFNPNNPLGIETFAELQDALLDFDRNMQRGAVFQEADFLRDDAIYDAWVDYDQDLIDYNAAWAIWDAQRQILQDAYDAANAAVNGSGGLAEQLAAQRAIMAQQQAIIDAIIIAMNFVGWMVGKDTLRETGSNPTAEEIAKDDYLKTLSAQQLGKLVTQEQMYLAMLKEKYGDDDYMVRYVQNTTTGEWIPEFYKKQDLAEAFYDPHDLHRSNVQYYTIGSEKKVEEIKNVNARLEQDSTGRIINITLNPDTPEQVTHAITTNTIADQDRYNDAINQYEYNKYQYDQAINEINAKIQIIQAQDKNLELRLKQLDTEQNAIQTEMDAVSKVIQKNVESTFKTFG